MMTGLHVNCLECPLKTYLEHIWKLKQKLEEEKNEIMLMCHKNKIETILYTKKPTVRYLCHVPCPPSISQFSIN